MAQILLTHEPFLHSAAQVFVLPVSADGNVLHPVLARCKTLFADNYQRYYQSAMLGELNVGQVMLNAVQKQQTGLGASTSRLTHIANLIVQKSNYHPVSSRTFEACLRTLEPMIYQLMRYQGIRRMAFTASPLLTEQAPLLTAEQIYEAWCAVFAQMPKLTIYIHFSKSTPLPQKVLENQQQTG